MVSISVEGDEKRFKKNTGSTLLTGNGPFIFLGICVAFPCISLEYGITSEILIKMIQIKSCSSWEGKCAQTYHISSSHLLGMVLQYYIPLKGKKRAPVHFCSVWNRSPSTTSPLVMCGTKSFHPCGVQISIKSSCLVLYI